MGCLVPQDGPEKRAMAFGGVAANSMSVVLWSQVAQVVPTGLGAILDKINELEDLLSMRGQELGECMLLFCFLELPEQPQAVPLAQQLLHALSSLDPQWQ